MARQFKAELSCLEIIVKYLKDKKKFSFKEISRTLNRRPTTIYTTYKNASVKCPKPLKTDDTAILIPINSFRDRRYSILESLVAYLKEEERLSQKEIAQSINRSYNTVKTVYRRYRKKEVEIEIQY